MRVEFLVNQAKKYIPFLTSDFSDKVKIASVEAKDNLFIITLNEALNLNVGDEAVVFLNNIPKKINISKLKKIKEDEAIITTNCCHEQTKDPNKDNKVFITIHGCKDNFYNGKTEVLEDYQDGGHDLRIKIKKEASDNPDLLGTYFYLPNYFLYNGLRVVKVIAKNKISFEVKEKAMNYYVNNIDDMFLFINTRIYPAYDLTEAKALFDRKMQIQQNFNQIEKKIEPIIKTKASKEYTAFIVLNDAIENTANNKTSVGFYNYVFSVYIFMMHRNVEKYLVRNEQDVLTHGIFNKIFGDKRIILSDNIVINKTTDDIKFLSSKIVERRDNDLSILEIRYQLLIKTDLDDYKLPIYNPRLNELDMVVQSLDSKYSSDIKILC